MNADTQQAQADLAYLKAIVEGGSWTRAQRSFGLLYLSAGVLYGLETLVHWGQDPAVLGLPGEAGVAAALVATLGFLAMLAWTLWRERDQGQGGMAQRAFGFGFAATGAANLAFVALFLIAAIRQQSFAVWLLYPAVVFGLQGAAWFMAWLIRKRIWLLAVALGWFANAIVLAAVIGTHWYVFSVMFGLIVLMGAPGAVLYFSAPRATS